MSDSRQRNETCRIFPLQEPDLILQRQASSLPEQPQSAAPVWAAELLHLQDLPDLEVQSFLAHLEVQLPLADLEGLVTPLRPRDPWSPELPYHPSALSHLMLREHLLDQSILPVPSVPPGQRAPVDRRRHPRHVLPSPLPVQWRLLSPAPRPDPSVPPDLGSQMRPEDRWSLLLLAVLLGLALLHLLGVR